MTGWTLFKLTRLHICLPATLILMIVGISQMAYSVWIPFVQWLVPTPVVVALAAMVIVPGPLYTNFAALERTLARTGSVRLIQIGLAWLLAALATWPGVYVDRVGPLVCVLVALGTVSVVLLGEYAWVVALAVGFGSVVVDGAPGRPMTTWLESVPVAVWIAGVVASGVAYFVWGPREVRRG
ncbi:hypothetical protein BJH93_05625 [Kocuria polaris]|nr:hypothetical protein [Kocuria polaris]